MLFLAAMIRIVGGIIAFAGAFLGMFTRFALTFGAPASAEPATSILLGLFPGLLIVGVGLAMRASQD
jgi:hypothetical protein